MPGHSRIEERFITVAGVPTWVLEVPGDGPTIVLLHGFTDSADSWRPVLAELASRSRRALAVDLPGHGRAGALENPSLTSLDRFAAALLIELADADGAVLAGNSLGGLVALRSAGAAELPILAVAGLGPGGLAYHGRLESFSRWVSRLDPILRLVDWLPVPSGVLARGATALYTRRLCRGRGDADLARRYASHLRSMRDVGRILRTLAALNRDTTLLDAAALALIDVPVLLIWGDCDHLADVSGAARLLDAVPASRLVLLDDCGHCPQVEHPSTVAGLLADLPALPEELATEKGAR